jgi:hypothetical protein
MNTQPTPSSSLMRRWFFKFVSDARMSNNLVLQHFTFLATAAQFFHADSCSSKQMIVHFGMTVHD